MNLPRLKQARRASLLLVDDDPSAIQVMSRMLAQYPDQRFATSGADALRLAREATPDLILLDADMPGMTGFKVFDVLRADAVLARVPVIFATSFNEPAVEAAALQRGAADFVSKPLVAWQLTARVRAQLRTQALIRELKQGSISASPGSAQRVAQRARVLIVDDDVVAIRTLRRALAALGDVYFAKSGAEALASASELAPDLILLDVHMPEVDGFAVCSALKAEPAFAHVPIVFVTRFNEALHELRAFELGAADFIAKPYTTPVLQARVRNLLELKRRTDAELHAVSEHWRELGDARVADVVGAASDAILTYDAQGRVVLINAAACRMFGVGHEQAVGHAVQALLGTALEAITASRSEAPRIALSCGDGRVLSVEVSQSVVGDGAQRLCTVMLRDASERERLETESRARAEAEAAGRAKAQLLAYVAHELGNPLHGLLGFSHLMGSYAAHPLPPEQARRLGHLVECAQRMQGLMRDVMDLGRCEAGQLQIALRRVDAAAGIAAAIDAVAAEAVRRRITLVFPSGATAARAGVSAPVLADADRLHQCLVNLLDNAVKYGRAGGSVHVELTVLDAQVQIAVRDDGIGMDAAQRAHLFEPFNRLGRERIGLPGTGLGLVITRQLVRAMQGDLQVSSACGAGSCFTLCLQHPSDAVQSAPVPADSVD